MFHDVSSLCDVDKVVKWCFSKTKGPLRRYNIGDMRVHFGGIDERVDLLCLTNSCLLLCDTSTLMTCRRAYNNKKNTYEQHKRKQWKKQKRKRHDLALQAESSSLTSLHSARLSQVSLAIKGAW